MSNENKNFTAPFAILSGALVLALAANGFLWVRTNNQGDEIAKLKDGTSVQIAKLSSDTEVERQAAQKRIEELNATVSTANTTATAAVNRARAEAKKQADQLSKNIQEQNEQVNGEISHLKDTDSDYAKQFTEVATNVTGVKTDVDGVKTEVGTVKEDVATTKTALEQHGMELKRMTGDLGVMSDRIATNGKDLNALRALGERNYYEFTLAKSDKSKKVGDVVLTFKKADPKRNRYTVDVAADDKKFEKKDKTINEPVQIYLGGNRQPSEIVINQVNKDQIVGYVSVPKVMVSRR